MNNIRQKLEVYFQGVRSESRKISWPNMSTLKQLTIFVIVLVALLAVFTGLVDAVFSRLVQMILR